MEVDIGVQASDGYYNRARLDALVSEQPLVKQHLKFDHVISSMNGESFWAKEYSVAVTWLKENLTDDFTLLHPFEFTGDLGCVSGLFLMAQGIQQIIEGKSRYSLVYASSDNAWRSAVCLLKS